MDRAVTRRVVALVLAALLLAPPVALAQPGFRR